VTGECRRRLGPLTRLGRLAWSRSLLLLVTGLLLRLWRGRLGRLRPREKTQRVHVPVRVRGDADAQVDVGLGVLGRPARADRADRLSFADRRAALDGERAQVEKSDGEAVRRPDRERESAAGHGPGERHRSGGRRAHGRALERTEVDAAVLPGGVRVVSQDEGS
jgi:hypothetical protein